MYNPPVFVRFVSGLFTFFLLLQTASAEEVTPWSFVGQMPKEARVIQLSSAQITNEGLLISTQTDGYIVWGNRPIEGPTDVVTMRMRSRLPTKASLLWQPKGAVSDELVQAYVDIPASNAMQNIDIVVSGFPQWNWRTEQFAIALPAGSEVVIEELQFRHWPLHERTIERWKSFWTFDTFRPYSINFLWGPLLAGNAPQRATLYDSLPPSAPSVMRYFYVFLAIVIALCVLIGWKVGKREQAFGWFVAVFVALWLLFDLRMGAEILSYATHDLKTFTFAAPEERVLRNYLNVHSLILRMQPELQKHERFAMVTPHGEVYFPLLRYYGYPSVILPDPTTWSGATAWAVMDRGDIWIDDTGRLRQGIDPSTATILTPPGHVALPLGPSTFLFTVP